MPLALQTSFSDLSRQEIEDHLTQVRARRMQAAMEYHAGQNLKLEREGQVVQRRIKQQYEMLAKEIDRLDQLDNKIQDRLNKLQALLQEHNLIEELRA